MRPLYDKIVQRLRGVGCRALFGVPGGGGNLELIEAAGRGDLPFVLTSTETGAALAAVAQAEVTGHPGACLTTLGPGAASVANGVACAFLDRAPLLVFTDTYPAGDGAAFAHQQFDQREFFAPITKWSGRLSPACAGRTLDDAFDALADLPPGPVHLDCPGEEQALPPTVRRESARKTPADAHSDSEFRRLVARARKPLVIVGLGARRAEDAASIRLLLEQHQLPALVTYKAKGVVADGHPSFAGVFTHAAIERPLIDSSDLLIGIGLDPVELLPRPWTYRQPIVYLGRWRVAEAHVPFAAQMIGDIGDLLGDVDAALKGSDWDLTDVRAQISRQRRDLDVPAAGLSAHRVVTIAAERLARDTRATVDAGAHMLPATMLWPAGFPNQMLISNGLSTMGFALPAAIGAALAEPSRRVVALTGDGGLLMCSAELLTAAREKLPLVVVVFNDASLSLIEIKQQRKHYRPSGVAIGNVNWPAVAEGFGVAPFVAGSEAELARAIDDATRISGPSLIEAKIDRSTYAKTVEVIRG